MSESPKGLFGLSAAELRDLKTGLRYGATIVLAVATTFLLLAIITNLIGYTPTGPSSSAEVTPEVTPEMTAEADN
jgi:hypothetical protein